MNAVCAARVSSAPSGGGELAGRHDRAAQRRARRVRRLDRNTRRQRVAQHHSVYRHADAAEDRDAQRAAEFGAGLRDRRRRARPLGRRRADDQVGGQREHRREAEREHRRADGEHREPGRRIDAREHREADRREREAARHHERRTDPPHEHAAPASNRPRSRGPTARVHRRRAERRQPEHQLQVLRQEEKTAERKQDRKAVRRQRRAEARHPEQAQVDQRIGQPQLAADERRADRQAGDDEQHGRRRPAPSWAMRLRPKITASTASSDSTALIGSRRPAAGSRYSGKSRGPTISSSTITGTPMRKTAPHQNISSTMPPTSGPIAPPTEKLVIQTPIAVVRCAGIEEHVPDQRERRRRDGGARRRRAARAWRSASGRSWRTRRRPTPRRTPPAPISSRRRRPIRSPSVPIVISEPATRNP